MSSSLEQEEEEEEEEKESVELVFPRKGGAGPGLINLGNTCFMNATLQALFHCAPFASILRRRVHSETAAVHDSARCVGCQLESLYARMRGGGGAVAPRAFANLLGRMVKGFRIGRQDDAQELMHGILAAYERACVGKDGDCPVARVCGGQLASQVVCAHCHKVSETVAPTLDLSLEVLRCNSLTDALRMFTAAEVLDSRNKYLCDACKHRSCARKRLCIASPPLLLAVQLKRFTYTAFGGKKISRFVDYPETLSLAPFMARDAPDADPRYRLMAVLVHVGSSTNSGHYFSYARAPASNDWHLYDDNHVSKTPLNSVLHQPAYMLFYVRTSLPPKPNMKVREMERNKHPNSMNLLTPVLKSTSRQRLAKLRKKYRHMLESNILKEKELEKELLKKKKDVVKKKKKDVVKKKKKELKKKQENFDFDFTFPSKEKDVGVWDVVDRNMIATKLELDRKATATNFKMRSEYDIDYDAPKAKKRKRRREKNMGASVNRFDKFEAKKRRKR